MGNNEKKRYDANYYSADTFKTKFEKLLDYKYVELNKHKRRKQFILDYDKKYGENIENTVKQWFAKKQPQKPSIGKLMDICDMFECDIDYFLTEQDCVKRKNLDALERTGLNEKAIEEIALLPLIDKEVLNVFFQNHGTDFLHLAIENYFRQSFQDVSITGLGETIKFNQSETHKIFEYMSNSFMSAILNLLIYDEHIANLFMKSTVNKYYDEMQSATREVNALYEQTEERKDFIKKFDEGIENLRDKNNKARYFPIDK